MKIELTISSHTLGDDNTEEENLRYAEAVKSAIERKYPSADISVELKSDIDTGSCRVSYESEYVSIDVINIASQVWESADY